MYRKELLSNDEFLTEIKEGLKQELSGHDVQFDQQLVHKTNEDLTGLTVRLMDRDDGRISPTIYPEKLYNEYKEGAEIRDMVKHYAEVIENTPPEFDLNRITAEEAKDHIRFSLVNTKANAEWLQSVPHIELADLSAIPRWHLSDMPDGRASFVVTDQVAQNLQMTKEEVLEIAQKNIANETFTVRGMSETISELMQSQGLSEDCVQEMIQSMYGEEKMYVITNESMIDGASAMMSDAAMQETFEKIGENYYLLPSSRHEVLAVPTSCISDPKELQDMVVSINNTEVSREDYLSDSIYVYKGIKHEISPVFDEDGRQIEKSEEIYQDYAHESISGGMSGR